VGLRLRAELPRLSKLHRPAAPRRGPRFDRAPQGQAPGSFTRVVVGDLKPDVLSQLAEDGGLGVLRDLAHLYHYYIHGPAGNAFMCAGLRGRADGGWQRVAPRARPA
jgi:structural maintenance of chromosomes flexible hinge domain-containing protein 1